MSEDRTYSDVLESAVADMTDRIENDEFDEDSIHEIADYHVPIYNWDRMQVAASNHNVYSRDLELASGDEDLITLVGIAIYETLVEDLYAAHQEIEQAEEENDEDSEA